MALNVWSLCGRSQLRPRSSWWTMSCEKHELREALLLPSLVVVPRSVLEHAAGAPVREQDQASRHGTKSSLPDFLPPLCFSCTPVTRGASGSFSLPCELEASAGTRLEQHDTYVAQRLRAMNSGARRHTNARSDRRTCH